MYHALKLKYDELKDVVSKVVMKRIGNGVDGQAMKELAALVSDEEELKG